MKPGFLLTFSSFCFIFLGYGQSQPSEKPLIGFDKLRSTAERTAETRFDSSLRQDNLRVWMKRLAARPHNVGSPYGKENAEFIASQFRSWGYDTKIEDFQ